MSSGSALNLIHITDTHLYSDTASLLLNMNTRHSFAAVLRQIRQQQSDIDAVVATGDITQDGSVAAYEHFLEQIRQLNAPCYWTPGNHDRRVVMQDMPGVDQRWPLRFTLGEWQIIVLDSSVPGQVYGSISGEQLSTLDVWLQQAGDTAPTLVCLHHNPAPGSAGWMQGIGLRNADALLTILGRHPQVRAVLHGHVHQKFDINYRGVRILCTPSTCIQFKPGVTDFTLDELGPAYRWLRLNADGTLQTGVERVHDFVLSLDHNAGGY